MTRTKTTRTQEELYELATSMGLWGLVNNWNHYKSKSWIHKYLQQEFDARQQRGLQRRAKAANIGRYKPMAEFDWSWPKKIDKTLVQRLFSLDFIDNRENIILLGNSGTGKTMIAKNLGAHAVAEGHKVLFTTATAMLNDLASQDAGTALIRRLKRYTNPDILIIDEIGYLASSAEYANLMFEVITSRYERRPIVLTSNKSVGQWGEVFPGAACVVAMVDRLLHRAAVVSITADSYRRKEATEVAKSKRSKKPKTARGARR